MAYSPIFRTPTDLIGLSPMQRGTRAIGDTLTALGIGLMGNGPSATPQSPLQGLSIGLQNANQMMAQRAQQDSLAQRDAIQAGQYDMERQKFDLATQMDEERKRQLEVAIADLPQDQQAAARADPDSFWKAYADHLFAKPEGAQSTIGKLRADLAAGRISQGDYDAAVKKDTYITPPASRESYRTVTGDAAKAMGLDPAGVYSVGSNGSVSLVQQPKAQPSFSDLITGDAAAAVGLDRNGVYQRGQDGKYVTVQEPPKPQTTYGDIITGDAAQALGLDPSGTYQKDNSGRYVAISTPKAAQTTFKTITGEEAKARGLDPAKTWSIGSNGEAKVIDKPAAEAGGVLTGDEAKALGLDPTGTYQKRPDGTYAVLVKPRAEGTFGGNALDAQDSNIILKGQSDPAFRSTPEYKMAWNRQYQQPKLQTTQDPNDPMKQVIQSVIVPPPQGFLPPTGNTPSNQPPVPTATPIPGTQTEKALSGEQALSKGFATRMEESNNIIGQTAAAGTDQMQALKSSVPLVGNYLISDQRQQLEQAERDFINAQLRRESGAAISMSEFSNARQQYFPQPGDSKAVLEQKARNRQNVIKAMKQSASPYPLPQVPSAADDLYSKYGLTKPSTP